MVPSQTEPVLYIVGTPIGNLDDLSIRMVKVLAGATLIGAEDTRSAHTLLLAVDALARQLAIAINPNRRVTSVFEGNENERADHLLGTIAAGHSVCLISEAGMPLVSDPGARIVATALAKHVRIEVVPGPTAAFTALIGSGLDATRSLFVGFPPREAGARQELLGKLRNETATMIFYEAPDRVATTCADAANAFGSDRKACLARELTKKFEEYIRGTVAEIASRFASQSPRGECTLVIAGATATGEVIDVELRLRELLAQGLGPKDAAARLMVQTGKSRRELYQLALSLARTER